jgi:hypothetical protein
VGRRGERRNVEETDAAGRRLLGVVAAAVMDWWSCCRLAVGTAQAREKRDGGLGWLGRDAGCSAQKFGPKRRGCDQGFSQNRQGVLGFKAGLRGSERLAGSGSNGPTPRATMDDGGGTIHSTAREIFNFLPSP